MPLGEYERKRAFDKTPEPKPAPGSNTGTSGPVFCVQRHDATRLHYDFRLEMDGVLKSWAVPKGPSLQPLAKALAVHVEDHPLDYGGFEGNIPKGQYGGGSVMLWDHGTYELLGDASGPDQIKRGDLKFRLHGEKLQGEFALVLMRGRGKGNEWLLIKKRDATAQTDWNVEDHATSVLTGRTQQEIAEDLPAVKVDGKRFDAAKLPGAVASVMPEAVTPMMAHLVDKPPEGDEWLYEVKWDGVRVLCFLEAGRLRMVTRTGNRCEQQYPELSVLPHHVASSVAILDGEVAVLDDKGRSSFGLIQPRIHVVDPNSIAHLARSKPATLFLFDVLYLDGYDLRGAPLGERKRALEALVAPSDHIRISEHFQTNGAAMLEAARANGLEGILAKRVDSKYEGRRSHDWLKIKALNQQEFVIAGFTHGDRDYFSSLVLGLYENGKLVHVGQVGTGFDAKSLLDIHEKLAPLVVKKSPFAGRVKLDREVTWVKPELVAMVRYLEFTGDGILRAPAFLGLRNDKAAKDCTRETPGPVGPLLDAAQKEATVDVDGHRLKFTNLDKVFYPGEGVTKRDVVNYYDAVAPWILPHLNDRPLSLKRYPNGIAADFFFQKDEAGKFPEWVRVVPIHSDHRSEPIRYCVADDRATLLYLANLACIDQNPWMSRIASLDCPDFALIDLDPQECTYDQIVEAAQLVHGALDAIGLAGYPKTTGGDGMHIYVPLEPVYSYEQVRTFVEIISHVVIGRQPSLFTTPRSVARRKKGRVYFDYLQIASAKTISAPYVLRAYAGAPVATPLAWDEVKRGLTPAQFTIHNAMARFERLGDLFAGVLKKPQRLEQAIEKLDALMQKR